MDLRSLLKSFDTIAEGETKETEKGREHKGDYGNKYGKEDVRDQYGHKIGKKSKEEKDDTPKKRGAPVKADKPLTGKDDPKNKKVGDIFGRTTGDVPKGKKGHQHTPMKDADKEEKKKEKAKKKSLKEFIEEVETNKLNEELNMTESKSFGPENPYEVKPGEDFSLVFKPGKRSGVHYHMNSGMVADPFYFKLNDKLYSVTNQGDGIPQEVQQGVAEGTKTLAEIDIDTLNQLASHAVNTLGQGGANFAAGATGGLVGGAIAGGTKKAVDWYYKQKQKKAEAERKKSHQQGIAEGGFFDPDQPNIGDTVKHINGATGKVKKIGTQGGETHVYFKDKNGEMNSGMWKKHVFPIKKPGVAEGTYSKDVERAFPDGKASGVKTGSSAPKGTSTMPKDKEKAKGMPAGSIKEMMQQTPIPVVGKEGDTQQTGAGFIHIDDTSPAGQAMSKALGDLAKQKKAQIVVPTQAQTNKPMTTGQTQVTEKWGTETKVSPEEKGKYAGKDKSELLKSYNALKKSGPHKKGSPEYGRMRELAFAIRAKSDWGKVKEDSVEESGLQAYLGNKKYGKEGMDALRKAGREGASKEKMAKIRAHYDKMDEEALDQPATMEQANGMGAIRMQGQKIDEKAVSKAQQKFMGMVHAAQKGEKPASKEVARVAKTMKKKDAEDFASTKHKGLPQHVKESVSLEESHETLEHIISKFKHEVKNFLSGQELDTDLYDALYDYYAGAGEMPYGVAKGRSGDPFQWVTNRFENDVQKHIKQPSMPLFPREVDEADIPHDQSGSIQQHRQGALKEPTSDFMSKDDTRMAMPRGTKTTINRPAPEPTPWSVDPVSAATDRTLNFLASLKKKSPFTESEEIMKDITIENWEKQLNSLLNEGVTVSSSTGQQGAPDSVSITATDSDAQTLLGVLRNAGIGGFGAEEKPEVTYGVASQGEEEASGTGTEPQPSPTVVGDGDDMLSLIKKMTGLDTAKSDDSQQDYADEKDDEEDSEEASEEGCEEEVAEAEVEEGNRFTYNLLKAREAGKSEADLDGDGDMEKVREGEDEKCNECGMYESECDCEHEAVEESFANEAGKDGTAEQELAKLKALLSMGGDLHKMKRDQTVLNPTQVNVAEALNDWKKLSGIK